MSAFVSAWLKKLYVDGFHTIHSDQWKSLYDNIQMIHPILDQFVCMSPLIIIIFLTFSHLSFLIISETFQKASLPL